MSQSQVNALSADAFPALSPLFPVAQATGTVSVGWVNMANFRRISFILDVGNTGANATVNAVVNQATNSSGAGSKVLAGAAGSKAITAITATGLQAVVNVAMPDLDSNNSYTYAQLLVTVGTASALISCDVIGDPTYTPPTLPAWMSQVIL